MFCFLRLTIFMYQFAGIFLSSNMFFGLLAIKYSAEWNLKLNSVYLIGFAMTITILLMYLILTLFLRSTDLRWIELNPISKKSLNYNLKEILFAWIIEFRVLYFNPASLLILCGNLFVISGVYYKNSHLIKYFPHYSLLSCTLLSCVVLVWIRHSARKSELIARVMKLVIRPWLCRLLVQNYDKI